MRDSLTAVAWFKRHTPEQFYDLVYQVAMMPEHVYSIGRNGSYRYGLDIDDCIEQAMIMARQIKEGGRDYPVPMEIWR